MSSWSEYIANITSFGQKKEEPSPAAQFLHNHLDKIIVVALYSFAMHHSMTGALGGLVAQAYISNKTELDESYSHFLEITDQDQITKNDLVRVGVPAVIGAIIPGAHMVTDLAVGFFGGSIATRKVVKLIAPHLDQFMKK